MSAAGSALRRGRAHIRQLWPRWPLLPMLPFVLYVVVSSVYGGFHLVHLVALAAVAWLAYAGPRTKAWFVALYPLALVGMLYDAMRPLQRVGLTAERVHLCDLRAVESRLFGYRSGGESFTLHDWFAVHHAPALDLLAAFPYATFVFACFAVAAYLAVRNRIAMRRFTWAFFLMNIAGFVTYHAFPAAPPWYYHAHGCTVNLTTAATEGPALARVDAMLGISYFHGMYAKASSVFGAVPSLHCAYPLLLVVAGWRTFGLKLKIVAIAYWLAMVFAAVYLDHHWVIDAIVGGIYAVAAFATTSAFDAARTTHLESSTIHGGSS